MKLRWLVVPLLVACGSKSSEPTDEQLCKKMSGLCSEVEQLECFSAKDWAEMQHDIGKNKVTKFRHCVAKANDCGALTGCTVELGLSLRGLTPKHSKTDDDDSHDVTEHHDVTEEHHSVSGGGANDGAQAAVHYDSVTIRSAQDSFGYHLAVSIELTVEGDMPHVGGQTTVEAFCDGKNDKDDAFFMKLSDAKKGEKRSDTINLFDSAEFDAPPKKCDIVLSMSKGTTAPAKYCYENEKTTPGACK
jgi:hypothetical protein